MIRVVPLLVWLAFAALAQTIQYSAVPQEAIEGRLGRYTTKNDKREPTVRAIFEEAGCGGDRLSEQSVKGLKAPNLICGLPGRSESVIVVGAHFDMSEVGNGVVDNWSGVSLPPSLYQGLAAVERQHTFRFVAFGGEEEGLLGSKAYAKLLAQTRDPVIAMVNLDTLGLAETEVWASRADPKLVHLMEVAAASVKLPVSTMNVEKVGTTDSESFREKKIPAITIHSLTQTTLPILHTRQDRIEAIRTEEYYRTYRLVLAYLAVLDQRLN